jgi:hypothetical protein
VWYQREIIENDLPSNGGCAEKLDLENDFFSNSTVVGANEIGINGG